MFLNTDTGLLKETGSCGGRPHSGEKGLHVYLHFEICNFDLFDIFHNDLFNLNIYYEGAKALEESDVGDDSSDEELYEVS